jgi:hypothetical protein
MKVNHFIHLPTAGHKIERRVTAMKRLSDWACLVTAEDKAVDPTHSILSVDAG